MGFIVEYTSLFYFEWINQWWMFFFWQITPDHEAGYGRSKSQMDNADKPSDQTNFSPPNPRDQTHDLNSSPKVLEQQTLYMIHEITRKILIP